MPKIMGTSRTILKFILLALLLAACSSTGGPGGTQTGLPVTGPPPETQPPAVTEGPTEPPALALLLAPPGVDSALLAAVQPVVEAYAAETGMAFELRESLSTAEVIDGLALVVALPPDPGVANLAVAFPDLRFVAVGILGITPAANLSVLSGGGARPDFQGFIAGYIAAVITEEWRAGVIAPSDTEGGVQARTGFRTGVRYFCGLCQQTFAPVYSYDESPLYAELPIASGPSEWQAAANLLIARAIRTIYLAPGAGDASLPGYLAGSGIWIIGSGPMPEGLEANWVASVGVDYAAPLLAVLRGELQGQVPLELEITQVNPALLSSGRLEHVLRVLEDLLAGYIDTGLGE